MQNYDLLYPSFTSSPNSSTIISWLFKPAPFPKSIQKVLIFLACNPTVWCCVAFFQQNGKRNRDRGQLYNATQHLFYYMEKVLQELQQRTPWKESMRKSCRINKLNVDLVSYFTPLRFRATYTKFEKIYQKKGEERSERWLENELKAFYWMCVAVSCVSGLTIAQFGSDQWNLLHQIFYCKIKLTLEYEAKKLIEDITNKANWQQHEDDMLTEVVEKCNDHANKWNQFARRLYEESGRQYLRTGKQCRERWLNHLDPSKKHGDWTAQEDKQIVELFMSTGKRWSKIAKKLGSSRTEHMIKNRYKTICSKQKKLYPQIKSEDLLMKSYLEIPTSTCLEREAKEEVEDKEEGEEIEEIEEREDEKTPHVTEIKTEHKSQPEMSGQPSEYEQEEEEGEEFSVNEFVVEEDNKSKLPALNPSFDIPQVYSPWYVSIPLTPSFSPSVPFFVNFSTNFSSFDSNFSNQFYCPKKAGDGVNDNL